MASESRVVPAIGATIARRDPAIRLKRVDFPTLGRPTSTTDGDFLAIIEGHTSSLSHRLDSVSVTIYSIYKT